MAAPTNFAVPGNNVSTTLTVASTGSGLPGTPYTVTLASTSSLPALTGSQYYRVTICQVAFAYSPTATTSNYTIYKADTLSGSTITLRSVLEGTTDRVYNIGDIVEIRVTAGTLSDIHTAVNALEYKSTFVTVSGTTALTSSAYGTTQVCSGTSANYTVTLPAPVSGGIIAFQMASGLTKLVTIAQHASETIDGAASRVMWANETALLVSDGTNWSKFSGKTIPMSCAMRVGSPNQTSVADSTSGPPTVIPMDTIVYDTTGFMADTTNKRISIVRTSNYVMTANLVLNPSTSLGSAQVGIFSNGSQVIAPAPNYVTPIGTTPQSACSGSVLVNSGSYIQLAGYNNGLHGGTAINTDAFWGVTINQVSVLEIPIW